MSRPLTPARSPRYAAPLRACDEVAAEAEGDVLRVRGITRIRPDGPYLAGHFPEITIFPGVFIMEAVVQAVVQSLGERNGQIARLRTVRSLRFLVPLYPGDELSFEACVADPASAEAVVVTAEGRRGDGVRVATMTLECWWSP